jgi:two-component system, LuxR family, response regulator FixJ
LSHIKAATPLILHSVLDRARNARTSLEPIAAKLDSQSTGKVPVVVIVDDDPAVCSSLKFSLELEGFAVRAYGNAAELLNGGDLGCDCFVIDQRMPGMSGMDLIVRLRSDKVATPAILLISHPNPAVSARATRANVPVVEKPLLGNMLVDRIRDACGR